MFLLAADTFMGQDVFFLAKLAGGIGALYAVYRHINKAKREIVADVIRELRGENAEQEEDKKRIIGPQPFDVRLHSDCVKRGSYETHCRLNREAHENLQKDFKHEVGKIADAHHQLAREVSALNARSEENQARLIQMDNKLDNIRRDLSKS